eukprot:961693-Heterocapsa_arctica.AAC.1
MGMRPGSVPVSRGLPLPGPEGGPGLQAESLEVLWPAPVSPGPAPEETWPAPISPKPALVTPRP